MTSTPKPFFVVITPVYVVDGKSLSFLKDCVESVAGQRYDNYLHLLFDDGSPYQPTVDYLKNVQDKYKKVVHVDFLKHGGVISTLQRLFDYASSLEVPNCFVTRLNCDDMLAEDAFRKIENICVENKNLQLIIPSLLVFYNRLNMLEKVSSPFFNNSYDLWLHNLQHKPFPMESVIWGQKLFKEALSIFDLDVPYSEDWDHSLRASRCVLDNKYNFFVTPEITYLFRKDDSSLGRVQVRDWMGKIKSYNKILAKQTSGFQYFWQLFRNIVRFFRIVLGLQLSIDKRRFLMPKHGIVLGTEDLRNIDSLTRQIKLSKDRVL